MLQDQKGLGSVMEHIPHDSHRARRPEVQLVPSEIKYQILHFVETTN